jgi:hypothetical protein
VLPRFTTGEQCQKRFARMFDAGVNSNLGEDKSSPKRRASSIHEGMAKLEIRRRVILTGQIFNTAKHTENRCFYQSKAPNENPIILTFILTLRF